MTTMNMAGELVDKYLEHLSGDFATVQSDGCCILSTPFLMPDGQTVDLEIVELPGGRALLSDMGNTMGYLFVNGIDLNQPAMDSAKLTAMAHGVRLEESEFSIEAGRCGDGGRASQAHPRGLGRDVPHTRDRQGAALAPVVSTAAGAHCPRAGQRRPVNLPTPKPPPNPIAPVTTAASSSYRSWMVKNMSRNSRAARAKIKCANW